MTTPWPMVALGEVLAPVSRPEPVDATKLYRLLGVRLSGGGPFLRETKLGSESAAATLYEVHDGDFIYSRLFAWRGAFGLIGPELDGCYVSGEFPIFAARDERIDLRFLDLWFRLPSTIERVEADCSGSTPLTRNRFKERFFTALTIPLPPLAEQRRIVARIEALAAKIEEARGLKREAVGEVERLAGTALGSLLSCAGGAGHVRDFVRLQSGYAFKSEWFADSGIRLARNANIGHGRLVWADTARIASDRREEFAAFDLAEGDILISLDRPIISTGVKVAKISKADLPCLLLQRVARVHFVSDTVSPDFFYTWLRSPHFVSAIDPGRSNGVPHISHKDIEAIPFAPPPLDEQRRIVAHLDHLQARVDALKRLQAETAAELDALLPSVLDRAFRGEL